MLEERGRVLAVDSGFAWVRIQRKSACGNCENKASCSTGSLSALQPNSHCDIKVSNEVGARVGDQVVLSMPDESLLQASVWMYFIPLLLMILTATAVEQVIEAGEWLTILASFLALGGGFIFARGWGKRHQNDPRFRPVMSRIC